jgi:hypothetical protein
MVVTSGRALCSGAGELNRGRKLPGRRSTEGVRIGQSKRTRAGRRAEWTRAQRNPNEPSAGANQNEPERSLQPNEPKRGCETKRTRTRAEAKGPEPSGNQTSPNGRENRTNPGADTTERIRAQRKPNEPERRGNPNEPKIMRVFNGLGLGREPPGGRLRSSLRRRRFLNYLVNQAGELRRKREEAPWSRSVASPTRMRW